MNVALAVTLETPSLRPFVTSTSIAEPVGGVTTPLSLTVRPFGFRLRGPADARADLEVGPGVGRLVSLTLQPVVFPEEPMFFASWMIV